MYKVTVGPTYEDAYHSYQGYIENWRPTIDRIVDLCMRTKMDTNTAEIVTAIIFAARRLKEIEGRKLSEGEVLEAVLRWKKRRRPPLEAGQVAHMIRVLAGLGWIEVTPTNEEPRTLELVPAE